MKIKSLKLQHFRRFEDFSIEFDESLTVLVAKNGAGKSSVLDALAIMFGLFLTRLPGVKGLGFKDSDFQNKPEGGKPPFMRITCETFDDVMWDRTEKRDQTTKTAKQIPASMGAKALNDYVDRFIDHDNDEVDYQLPILVYYGTGRGVFEVPQRKRGFSKSFHRFDSFKGSLSSRTNFKSFVEYFYSLEDLEAQKQKDARSFDVEIPELKAIRTAVSKMMPEFSNPKAIRPAGIAIDWKCDGIKKTLRIEQLSDGFRTSLAMVMDIAARMAEANPAMDDPLDTEGVVLIDEVDLHLHPGWQQNILLDLQRTFQNVQFIVSTHSPQVISSVKPESLRVIEWQEEKPKLLDIRFSEGAEAQQMLLQVLGLDSPRVEGLEIVQDLKRYQALVSSDQWDTDEAHTLKAKLREWGAEYEPELSRLELDIRMKEWERQQANK